MAGSAYLQDSQSKINKLIEKFINKSVHVNSLNDELGSPSQSFPLLHGKPYIGINYVRPSEIDLTSPHLSVHEDNYNGSGDNLMNANPYIGINYVRPSEIDLTSPPLSVHEDTCSEDGIIFHDDVETDNFNLPIDIPVPHTIDVTVDVHEVPRYPKDPVPLTEKYSNITEKNIVNQDEYDKIEVLEILNSSETPPPLP